MTTAKPEPAVCWADLGADDKRDRLLAAAGEVFARDGIDAPIPAVAAAVGAGIGSVYRQFPSKRDLLAALVGERLKEAREEAEAARSSSAGPWVALTGLLWRLAERQAGDDVLGEAMATLSEHPEVKESRARTTAALEGLLAAARAEGRLRNDATTLDLRLIFAAVRASAQVEPAGWRRMLELGIDGLESRPAGGSA